MKGTEGVGPGGPTSSWRRYALGWWIALLVIIGVLRALNRYLIDVANAHVSLFVPKLIDELTGALSFGACLPLVFFALRALRGHPYRWLGHLGVFAVLSVAQTTLMMASRYVVFGLAGLDGYAYGPDRWRYLMEVPTQLFFYVVIAVGLWLFDSYRAGRARELRAAHLESALSEARLEALRLQLNPHFLFNTLHAVSELMYEQPRVADEMLSRVGALLRATLAAGAQEHRLQDEWRLLALYMDIQKARFGEGLDASVENDPSLDDLRFPFLLLQPIVENAIEHGGSGDDRRVQIRAERDAGLLTLRVRDFGGGPVHTGHGIGLANVGARLRHLYGDQAGVRLDPVVEGGSLVTVWLPARRWEVT